MVSIHVLCRVSNVLGHSSSFQQAPLIKAKFDLFLFFSIKMTSERNQSEENALSTSGPSQASLQQMLALSTSLTNDQSPNITGPVDKEVTIEDL